MKGMFTIGDEVDVLKGCNRSGITYLHIMNNAIFYLTHPEIYENYFLLNLLVSIQMTKFLI